MAPSCLFWIICRSTLYCSNCAAPFAKDLDGEINAFNARPSQARWRGAGRIRSRDALLRSSTSAH